MHVLRRYMVSCSPVCKIRDLQLSGEFNVAIIERNSPTQPPKFTKFTLTKPTEWPLLITDLQGQLRGLTITMVINHLVPGMILQVGAYKTGYFLALEKFQRPASTTQRGFLGVSKQSVFGRCSFAQTEVIMRKPSSQSFLLSHRGNHLRLMSPLFP